jgi:hypothetical protein
MVTWKWVTVIPPEWCVWQLSTSRGTVAFSFRMANPFYCSLPDTTIKTAVVEIPLNLHSTILERNFANKRKGCFVTQRRKPGALTAWRRGDAFDVNLIGWVHRRCAIGTVRNRTVSVWSDGGVSTGFAKASRNNRSAVEVGTSARNSSLDLYGIGIKELDEGVDAFNIDDELPEVSKYNATI